MENSFKSYSWYVNLSDTFNNLPAILQEKGFYQEEKILMICKLDNIPPEPSFDIKLITEEHGVKAWMQVFAASFESTRAFIESYNNHLQKNIKDHRYGEYYGIYKNHKLVTIGTFFPYKDFAFIANIATLPTYRGNGYATCMTKALMQQSQILGLKYMLLTTSNAQGFYEKLGFELYDIIALHAAKNIS